MGPRNVNGEAGSLVRLPWDSTHFGFEVASIGAAELDDNQLAKMIRTAQDQGFALVYWVTEPDRLLSEDFLNQWKGQLVDRRVTYTQALEGYGLESETDSERSTDDRFRVVTVPQGPATERLIALAIDAGRFSRYRRDSRFPPHLTEQLYKTWIERSTRREIADMVLAIDNHQGDTVGMITVSQKQQTCQVGLLAVDASVRRAGLGRRLLSAANEWSIGRGALQLAVVTQTDNVAACRLYERCGYRVHDTQLIYHFWPL